MVHKNKKPQLFINFRGKDERLRLLPHLKHHLAPSEVRVVTDDDAIGEPLDIFFKYIRKSRIVIVIFSASYLESDWCLNELVEIRRCLRTERVDYAIPIFYNVNTSDVKNQTGDFKDQFLALQNEHPESIKIWKKALSHVCKFAGLSFHNNSSELDFVKRIVKKVDDVLEKVKEKDWNDNYSLTNWRDHKSKKLEALNLQISREQYKRDDLLKHQSHNYCPPNVEVSSLSHNYHPYVEESSSRRGKIVPQDPPCTAHRRRKSFPDDINKIDFSSFLDETTVVIDKMIVDRNQPFENQVSIENNLQRKKPQFIKVLLQATTVFIIFRQMFFR